MMPKDPLKYRKLVFSFRLALLVILVAFLPMALQHLRSKQTHSISLPFPLSVMQHAQAPASIPASPEPPVPSLENQISSEIVPANAKTPPKIDYENPPPQHQE
jgi:hypothetical protein